MSIDVNNESGYEVDELELIALSRSVLDAMRVHPAAELSIVRGTISLMRADTASAEAARRALAERAEERWEK